MVKLVVNGIIASVPRDVAIIASVPRDVAIIASAPHGVVDY